MGLGVCSWGIAGVCPKLFDLGISSSTRYGGITSRSNGGGVWRRHENAAGWGCRWSQFDNFAGVCPLSVSRRRRKSVVTNASRSRYWKDKPLVKGRVTRRAMHIVQTLRSLTSSLQADEIDAALQKWVVSMQPSRKDWLTVLKEFDNKLERLLFFEISEWGLQQPWFEAGIRDYSKLIDRYGKEGNIVDAERMLRTMEDRGIIADLAVYTILIATYGRAKTLEKVHQTLQEISLAGLELDAVFYKTMIVAYGSAGLLKEAEDVLLSMESSSAENVPEGGRLDAYLALLTAYGRQGQATDAQRIFDRMHFKGFRGDVRVFTALMEAYGNAKDFSNAELIFQSLRAAGLRPDDRAVASLISVYGDANMLGRAAEVLVELERAGIKTGPITLGSLIGWFGEAGLAEEAEESSRELQKRKGLRVSA